MGGANLLLNDTGDVSLETINQIPRRPTENWMDIEPVLDEVQTAIGQLSDGKAPDVD